MKKIFFSLSVLLVFCLFSCSYDYHKFFFRGPHVDERAKEIKKFSSPEITGDKVNFVVVTDLHFGGKKKEKKKCFSNLLKIKKLISFYF